VHPEPSICVATVALGWVAGRAQMRVICYVWMERGCSALPTRLSIRVGAGARP
jgi:hypothetical protein